MHLTILSLFGTDFAIYNGIKIGIREAKDASPINTMPFVIPDKRVCAYLRVKGKKEKMAEKKIFWSF